MMNREWDEIPERDSGFPASVPFGKIHPSCAEAGPEMLGFLESRTVSQNCHTRWDGHADAIAWA
jgi:hypothetical protein